MERYIQMSSDLATNQISLLNSHPNPAHRKYERFASTIRIGLKYLSTSHVEGQNVITFHVFYIFLLIYSCIENFVVTFLIITKMSLSRLGFCARQIAKNARCMSFGGCHPPPEFGGLPFRYLNMPEYAVEPREPQKTFAEIKAGICRCDAGVDLYLLLSIPEGKTSFVLSIKLRGYQFCLNFFYHYFLKWWLKWRYLLCHNILNLLFVITISYFKNCFENISSITSSDFSFLMWGICVHRK